MGRMKEFCIDLINANGGIPEGMTIEDAVRMKELEMYNWQEYEERQERLRLQHIESANPREIAKKIEAEREFSKTTSEGETSENSEQ
jgi:hypothetical protein